MAFTQNDLDELKSALQTIKAAADKLKRSIEVQRTLQTLQSSCNNFAKHVASKVGREILLDDWNLVRDTGLNEINGLLQLAKQMGTTNDVIALNELQQVLASASELGTNLQSNNMGIVEKGYDSLVQGTGAALRACRNVDAEELNRIWQITSLLLGK